VSEWEEPDFSISEESKDAWKILKHHTEVASDRIYEELPDIIQHAFEEGIAYAREQIAREIEICEPCFNDVWCGKDEKNQDCSCICHQYAAIARGEPNQVTKDAIEEARKRGK